MKIEKSFVMWIGGDHYEDAKAYVEEVRHLGVSKRLPGYGMAVALNKPGAIVYVAHDDGEFYSCDACMGKVVCGDCRVREVKIGIARSDMDNVLKHFGDESDIPRQRARIVEIRRDRIAGLESECDECETCNGKRHHKDGTGGYVRKVDGSRMDYRSFNYWMRQPKKFNAKAEVESRHMCDECGGTGKIPRAMIFGAFIPTVEYIRSGRENEVVESQIEDFRQVDGELIEREAERGGEKRRPGFYAVARKGKATSRAKKIAPYLRSKTEVIGEFIRFKSPVEQPGLRRFRGLKRFSLVGSARSQRAVLEAAS